MVIFFLFLVLILKKLLDLDFRKEHAIMKERKIGKDKEVKKKPITLLEFLKHGSKKED